MIENLFYQNILVVSTGALVIYLILALILGWALRAVLSPKHSSYHKRYHIYAYKYPQPTHSYVEHIPEIETAQERSLETTYDLKVIEGIDIVTEQVLNSAGIITTEDLSQTTANELREILSSRRITIPEYTIDSWPYQAGLAWSEQWSELHSFQYSLQKNT